MLTGTVNDLQPWLAVELLTIGGPYLSVEVVLDTGFNGELALPISITRQLDLAPLSNRYTYLAVGGEVELSTWRGTIFWNGRPRFVEIVETDSEPLLGMELLLGNRIAIEVREGGAVVVDPLP